MSLKAKIEAVIYASEEPVTLLQLVGLLGQEAQAELDAADARQGQLALLEIETPDAAEGTEAEDTEAGDPKAEDIEALNAEAPVEEASPGMARADELGPASVDSGVATGTGISEAGLGAFDSSPSREDGFALAPEPSAAEIRGREKRLREFVRAVLDELVVEYANGDRGLEIREVAGGFRFATKPEYHDAVRGFVRSLKPPLKLSLQALETLAVVAYKQPVTSPEVSEIRGVDSAGVLGSLMGRKLVTTAGRKQVIGRPILYKTTKEFLLRFGLKDLSELPSIEEFERLASDLNEAVQEEIPMAERLDEMRPTGVTGDASRAVEPMREEHMAQADGVPDNETQAENTTPLPDEPGEFSGDETVAPADNASIDGRISGLPPRYDEPGNDGIDSPALDAEVQGSQAEGEA